MTTNRVLDFEVWGAPLKNAESVVLGIHGITANRYAMHRLAKSLPPHISYLAPDLRGRGRSSDAGPPYGIRQHVKDLTALIDYLDCGVVDVIGHSMGAFVGAMLSCAHPDRVKSLTMVDGGIPMPVPDGADPDLVLTRALGPTLARLDEQFQDFDDYLKFWAAHPAMAEVDQEYLLAYSRHDVIPDIHPLRSAANREAVFTDGRELMIDEEVRSASSRAPVTTAVFRAARGMLNEETPRITKVMADQWLSTRSEATCVEVADCNHFSILANPSAISVVIRRWHDYPKNP